MLDRLPLRHLPTHRRRTARRQDRPTSVATHPRVFATLTAPGFGAVHIQRDTGRCHCGARHADDGPILGTPLDPDRYDYTGAVLWNAHAPALWARFTTTTSGDRQAAGLTQRALRHHATLSYAKVAEYQKHGQVHFHAVIRLDGPTVPAVSRPLGPPPSSSTTPSEPPHTPASRTKASSAGPPGTHPGPRTLIGNGG
ncbi:replication initiator [Streptomyces sp. HUAS ZL42]|uniref:replication initiator n=1 Tax=Streptomyces sp. HUAS ZL42 TaxID=3231715 RepID=UPI00345E2F6C